MKVRTSPLLGAAGWGITLQLAVEVLRAYLLVTLATATVPWRVVILGPVGAVSVLTILTVGVGVLVDIGIGFLYPVLHRREAPLGSDEGAAGGSAAVSLSHLISGAFGLLLSVYLLPLLAEGNPALPATVGGTAVANLARLGGWLVAGAVLGAAGGVLGVALGQRRPRRKRRRRKPLTP